MKKVLIVEDERDIALLEKDYLEIYGIASDILDNGNGVLSALNREHYDLVVLDVMLPGKSGYELCRLIREQFDLPILMVTARNEPMDIIRGLGLGADDYISKPFDPAEFVARVNAHLNRYERLKENKRCEAVVFDNVEIHLNNRKVFVDGREVKMPNKEYELLQFLCMHPNVVYSKETLLDHVWGYEAFGDVATVTVHVNRIREKIEQDSAHPKRLETVWGVGYRFNL
ncbi:MAG: response regulator transcription factor [Lachnospiraceae bacterium]